MAKNKTRFKSLDVVNADSRVREVYQDGDGIWLDLEYGFTADPLGAHDIHEMRVRDVLSHYKMVEPCACDQCVEALAKSQAHAIDAGMPAER